MIATDENTEETTSPRYDIAESRLEEAFDRVDKANRRLIRNGILGKFTLEVEHYEVESVHPETKLVTYYPRAIITLNVPSLKLAGYTFVASLTLEPGGMITRTAPGQSLDGWDRPSDYSCQHCGIDRRRVKGYVIREDETGDLFQVGSTCLAAFLGVKPSGLWVLEYNMDDLTIGSSDEQSERGPRTPVLYSIRHILALAWVVSLEGRKFVTRGQAKDREDISTADETLNVWHHVDHPRTYERNLEVAEFRSAALALEDEHPEVVDAIIAEADTLRADSDFGMNVQAALNGDSVTARTVPLVVSLISVHMRNAAKRRETAERPAVAAGFIGDPKDKFANLTVTARTALIVSGYYGDKTLVVFQTEEGHMVKWMASKVVDIESGKSYKIAGTVKGHDNYRGDDQTVVERVKFTEITA